MSQLKEYYLTVKGKEVNDSGLSYVEENQNGAKNVKYDYLFLKIDEKLLVIEAMPNKNKVLSYSGMLEKMPEDVSNKLVEILKNQGIKTDEINKVILPFVLNTVSIKSDGYIILSLLGLIFISGVINIIRLIIRTKNHNFHPIIKSLSSYGNSESLIKEIEVEISSQMKYGSKVRITKSWIFIETPFNLKVIKQNDLIWIYTAKLLMNGATLPTRGISFHLKNGKLYYVGMMRKDAEDFSSYLQKKCPWCIFGFSNELKSNWKNHRNEMIEHVEKRKSKYQVL
jgi:hypothetical protein